MMIDFALEAERQGRNASESHLRGVPAALPPHHDDHRWRRCSAHCRWRSATARAPSCAGRWASAIVGGLIVSQMLTLYTTPVVYLYLDRFQEWLLTQIPWRKKKAVKEEAPVFAD